AIPIHLAAVNPYMCQVAGEVADGIRTHPVCTPRYIAEVMWPAARRGAEKTGRGLDGFAMSAMPLIATAADQAALEGRVRDVRARIAFYASTPAYLIAFESEGYGDVARELQHYSRAQRWEEMPGFVDDDMLDSYAVTGTYDEIAGKLSSRFAGCATHLQFAIPAANPAEQALLRDLLASLRVG